tara:strand:+ start:1657 stop:2919 length:1263 start_codon:yes stop_codon:yes gene_type:complete
LGVFNLKELQLFFKENLQILFIGIGVKRWLLIGAAGVFIIAMGLAWIFGRLLDLRPPKILPVSTEATILIILGICMLLICSYGLYKSLGKLMFASRNIDHLISNVKTRKLTSRGPKIVAIGGGTGLSVLLRGLKNHTDNITAIVTVADDGGSSGRLRKEMDVLPPGDFRNCIVALSDAEKTVRDLFQYRFSKGQGLEGHSFGNLFIVAMMEVTGSFDAALREAGKVLAVRGSLVPATMENIRLLAKLADGTLIAGESQISKPSEPIQNVYIEPKNPKVHPEAETAILDADAVVLGPGSLFTSVLPNLMVPGIKEAIQKSNAVKIYICNVATQVGETDGYNVADHIIALQNHTYDEIVDFALVNSTNIDLHDRYTGEPVVDDGTKLRHAKIKKAEIADVKHPVRHTSQGLAREVLALYHNK